MKCFPFVALIPFFARAEVDVRTLSWSTGKRLDKRVSDHTSTLGSNGLVYIAGGCTDLNGNKFDTFTGVFECNSITNDFYTFNPTTDSFNTNFPPLPRARYRHAAAWVNQRLWLIGGRDIEGNGGGRVVLEIDVFDPRTNSWSTPFSLSSSQGVSDLAAFASGSDIYMVGGLSQFFSTRSNVWKIDGSNLNSLQITAAAPLNQARRSMKAYTNGQGHAYVAGGIASCANINSVEKYTINANSWSAVTSMIFPRGNLAVTGFAGQLLAVGGEQAFDSTCLVTDAFTGENTATIAHVEILNESGSNSGQWTALPSIPVPRMRFDAVVFGDRTYIFGGQGAYDSNCQCYPTTDEVLILEATLTAPAPTSAPTLSAMTPTEGVGDGGGGGIGGFCFPGDSHVEVLSKGSVALKDISIGDMVKVDGDKFSQVFSFGHYDRNVRAKYLSIDAGLESPIVLSPDHMVFVENNAVPASTVSIGDNLTLGDGSASVKSIKSVIRTGAFAPFTKDGTIVVNGVVASSYVSLQSDSSQLEIGGFKTFSMHAMAHISQAPHRIVCELRPSYCATETYHDGISVWIETPLAFSQWLLRQNAVIMGAALFVAFALGVVAWFVETLIVNPVLLVCTFAAVAGWTRTVGRKKGNV